MGVNHLLTNSMPLLPAKWQDILSTCIHVLYKIYYTQYYTEQDTVSDIIMLTFRSTFVPFIWNDSTVLRCMLYSQFYLACQQAVGSKWG